MKRLFSLSMLLLTFISSCKKDATETQQINASQTDEVKFVYNGDTVKYGKIVSPVTGRIWLDRNLGASRRARSFHDYHAYGDLFQWGRPADGHQLMIWTSSTTGAPVNGSTSTLSTTNNPGNNLFITNFGDWRTTFSPRWSTAPNGPCPKGWHVPTRAEWQAENLGTTDDMFTKLKIVLAGDRRYYDGNLESGLSGLGAEYWTSSVSGTYAGTMEHIDGDNGALYGYINTLTMGASVRCIKNQ